MGVKNNNQQFHWKTELPSLSTLVHFKKQVRTVESR